MQLPIALQVFEIITHLLILLATKACVELFEEHDATCRERVLPDDTESIQRPGPRVHGKVRLHRQQRDGKSQGAGLKPVSTKLTQLTPNRPTNPQLNIEGF